MARKGLLVRIKRKPKYRTRLVRHCSLCGRQKGYLKMFNLCRICFLERVKKGEIPGFRKISK